MNRFIFEVWTKWLGSFVPRRKLTGNAHGRMAETTSRRAKPRRVRTSARARRGALDHFIANRSHGSSEYERMILLLRHSFRFIKCIVNPIWILVTAHRW